MKTELCEELFICVLVWFLHQTLLHNPCPMEAVFILKADLSTMIQLKDFIYFALSITILRHSFVS